MPLSCLRDYDNDSAVVDCSSREAATRLLNMNAILRRCLLMLICLALPLSALQTIAAPVAPCPMNTAGTAKMAPATSTDAGQDCCQEMGSASEHGKPCKPGQECRSASLLQASTLKPAVTLSSPMLVSFSSDFLPAQTPSGVWRPPRV